MKKNVYAIFNVEKEEKSSVSLFLIQSVFLGIFYGAFDVGAHALFLNEYPASMIPKAYVISGIVGIVLTSMYAMLQSRIKFSTLAIINLIFIALSTAALRILFQFTESPWLVFLIFIMMGPLNIIALLSFWGAVGRIFSLRQGKRLFGLIDSGQIFGAILSTFAIPVLIAVGFAQKNLLFLSSVSVGCALIVQIVTSVKFNLNQQVQKGKKKERKSLFKLLKNRYVLYMSIFVVMSMLAAFFIQFSFLSVTKENYPDHNDLAEFLGAFTGSLLLFTFLFKTFLYSKLMKTYGLKVSILISSFLLGIFTIIAALIGSAFGYTIESASFIFFFLVISLSRLFSKALKDGVEVPSFKILYQSLKAEIRHDVQAYVDGTINEIAALSAGLILAALSLFEFFKLIHFSYSLIIILLVWFFFSRKLYAEYKISLQKSLAEYKGKTEQSETVSDFIDNNLNNSSKKIESIIPGLEIDYELHPIQFETKIDDLVNHKNKEISEYTKGKIIEFKLLDSVKYLNDSNKISDQIKNLNIKIDKSPGIEQLIKLSKSKGTEDRIIAAHLIGKFYEPELFVYLKALIRDLQQPVKIAAIKAAAKSKKLEFCTLIIDYLDTPGLISHTYDALLSFGEDAINTIDQYFYKTGVSHRVLLRIVKLIGQIGGEKAKLALLKKLDHPNEEILNYVLKSINNLGFTADEKSIAHIHQIIEKHIGVMGYNIAAQSTLDEIEGFDYLKQAFKEEITSNYELLYLLLSIAYDAQSVLHVKENMESGTAEGSSYALELLDLFINDEIKPKLFPIVEDISQIEKIKQLQNYYPVEKLDFNELLISIINKDINETNIWTKACAIYAFSEVGEREIPNDLIAHLFNPNEILRETAGVVINDINKDQFHRIGKRLNPIYREELESTLDLMNETKNHLLVEKTWFLKANKYFSNVDGRYLYELAKCMNNQNYQSYELTDLIVSDLKDKILLTKGKTILLTIDDKTTHEVVEGELYDMNELLKDAKRKVSIEKDDETILYFIEKNDLIYNVFDFHKIELAIINWINSKIKSAV